MEQNGIPMQVEFVLGEATVMLQDIKYWQKGTVVELDSEPGSTYFIKINGKKVAKGEPVVVENKMGFRISQILK